MSSHLCSFSSISRLLSLVAKFLWSFLIFWKSLMIFSCCAFNLAASAAIFQSFYRSCKIKMNKMFCWSSSCWDVWYERFWKKKMRVSAYTRIWVVFLKKVSQSKKPRANCILFKLGQLTDFWVYNCIWLYRLIGSNGYKVSIEILELLVDQIPPHHRTVYGREMGASSDS